MKKSSKKKLAKRGVAIAGRAPAMGGTQVHVDKRKPHRSAQKQSLKQHIQHETARNRGPFSYLDSHGWMAYGQSCFMALNKRSWTAKLTN